MVRNFCSIPTAILWLILLRGFECQKKIYYIATSSVYAESGKQILEKAMLSINNNCIEKFERDF